MSTVFPPLTPAEARILDALFAGADRASDRSSTDSTVRPEAPFPAFDPRIFHTLGLSASDILAWSSSPAVAAALSSLRQTLTALAHLSDLSRAHAARPLALDALSTVISTSDDLNQRRLAASSLLRTTTPRPASPRPSHREPVADRSAPSNTFSSARPEPPPNPPATASNQPLAPPPAAPSFPPPFPPARPASRPFSASSDPAEPEHNRLNSTYPGPPPDAMIALPVPHRPGRAAALLARVGTPARPP